MKEWLNKLIDKNKRVIIAVPILILGIGVSFAFIIPYIENGATKDTSIMSGAIDKLEFKLTPDGPVTLNPNQETLGQTSNSITKEVTAIASLFIGDHSKITSEKYNVYVEITGNTFGYSKEGTPEILLNVKKNGSEITNIPGFDSQKTVTPAVGSNLTGFDITTGNKYIKVLEDVVIADNPNDDVPTIDTWNFKFTYVNLPLDQGDNAKCKMNIKVIIQKDRVTPVKFAGVEVPIVTFGEGLYHHNGSHVDRTGNVLDANDNSYRYAGGDPNNYICIGSDVNPCPDNNMYRIIGIFDGKLKVIKSSPLKLPDGNVAKIKWNSVKENIWNQSTLYKGLNGIEIVGDNKPAYDYYNIVLKPLVEGKTIDSSAKWYIDGHDDAEITPKEMHDAEIKKDNPNTITAPIGLMYAHDYGYGASSNNWTTTLLNNKNTAKNENWLISDILMSRYGWLITRYSSYSGFAFVAYSGGTVGGNYVTDGGWVRPVYYLVSDTKISNGDGTLASPYQI